MRGDSGVAGEGRVVGVPKFHSWGKCTMPSLVPRPLPDFISQPWRKIGRRPGTITTSRTGNGGLG